MTVVWPGVTCRKQLAAFNAPVPLPLWSDADLTILTMSHLQLVVQLVKPLLPIFAGHGELVPGAARWQMFQDWSKTVVRPKVLR